MSLVTNMSNSQVFGSPMILTGHKAVSPFGAAPSLNASQAAPATTGHGLLRSLRDFLAAAAGDPEVRKTVSELSKLDDRMLRDIGLNRSAIISAANEATGRKGRRFHR